MLSKETTYSQARMNLASILDEVCDEHQIIVIKRRNQKNVALIAEDELSILLESVYLQRFPLLCDTLKKSKYHSVVKPYESIFSGSPKKNSDSTLGRKDVNQESSDPVLCEYKSSSKTDKATTNRGFFTAKTEGETAIQLSN
jgi:PHD/YefM family antitoxin component YafN of YafNO toxin-antitoxin module